MTRNAQLDKQVSDLRESLGGLREEKQAFTKQHESVSVERTQNRNAHQKARTLLKETQKQVKSREMDIARLDRKQETLQRQALKLQADVNGLNSRIQNVNSGSTAAILLESLRSTSSRGRQSAIILQA